MKKIVRKIAVLLAAVMMIGMMSGCGTATKDYATTVAAVYGDENIYMDEAAFFLRYQQWFQEAYYWDMYQLYYGYADLWQAPSGVGTQTMGQNLKEAVMAQLIQTRILAEHADEMGISLTDADKAKVAEAAASFRANVAPEFFEYAPIEDARMIEILEENAVAVKVWDAVKKSKEVEVSDEECQMFTIEYVYVPVTEAAEGTLANGELAQEVMTRLLDGKTFEDFEEELGVTHYDASYRKNGETNYTDLYTAAAAMKTGDVQVIGDEENGWYVIQCVTELDEAATEAERLEVADSKQEEYFNEVYTGWAASAKTYKVEKAWDNLKFDGKKIYVDVETTAAE